MVEPRSNGAAQADIERWHDRYCNLTRLHSMCWDFDKKDQLVTQINECVEHLMALTGKGVYSI
jgi:hypothetical protein